MQWSIEDLSSLCVKCPDHSRGHVDSHNSDMHCRLVILLSVFTQLEAGCILQDHGATDSWLHTNQPPLPRWRLQTWWTLIQWNKPQIRTWCDLCWHECVYFCKISDFCKYDNMDLKINNVQKPSQCTVPKESSHSVGTNSWDGDAIH